VVEHLEHVTLKSGETVQTAAIRGPDAEWRDRIQQLLGHKGDIWNWQNCTLLTEETGVEAWFYVLHRDGVPFSHQMTAERDGVGIFGHVWTEPVDRGQGAAGALMAVQMAHFKSRNGRALVLGTTYDSAPYRLYAKHGFVSVEPLSGVMTWSREDFIDFSLDYFAGQQSGTVEPLQWQHWPVAPLLFVGNLPGIVRCAPLGLFGRQSTEEALLPLLRRTAGDPVDTQVAVLRLGNDAVAGLAALGPDPLAPGAACVDICVHPAHRSRAVELLTQVLPTQSHGRITAYADPAQSAKIGLLQDRGFREVSRWPTRLPIAPALSECADLIMFERRG
jgi:GNAT superfamily N-acetyltransferase